MKVRITTGASPTDTRVELEDGTPISGVAAFQISQAVGSFPVAILQVAMPLGTWVADGRFTEADTELARKCLPLLRELVKAAES